MCRPIESVNEGDPVGFLLLRKSEEDCRDCVFGRPLRGAGGLLIGRTAYGEFSGPIIWTFQTKMSDSSARETDIPAGGDWVSSSSSYEEKS